MKIRTAHSRTAHSRTMLSRTAVAALAAAALTAPLVVGPAASAGAAPADAAFPALTAAGLVASDFTLYLADSGTRSPDVVGAGDHLGLYQRVTDQAYGVDVATGANWGYVAGSESNPIISGPAATTGAPADKRTSLRYDDEPAGADLTTRQVAYDFDLPAATYQVTVGFQLPAGWGGRSVVVAAEGHALETLAIGPTLVEKTYAVAVTDGQLNLAVQSPADRTDALADPAVSYLVVKATPDWSLEVLQARVDQSALTADQTGGYAPTTVAALAAAVAAGQELLDARSTDAAAIEAAYRAIMSAFEGLRAIETYDSFRPGQPWLDDQGMPIQAHGGQVVPAKDSAGATIYYWYGEDRTNGYSSSPGVHVYSSHDLYNWTDEGLALRAMSSAGQFDSEPYFQDLYAGYTGAQKAAVYRDLGTVRTDPAVNPAILERPKVVHNAATGQWVMWVHADGPSATSNAQYAKAQAGVAVSDSPFGPFRYIDSYRLNVAPAGEPNYQPDSPGMARDMNLFVDDDGTAYIVYSSEENYSLFISKLNADYTQLSSPVAVAVKGVDFTRPYVGAHREAPALFKFDGTYYLITSAATGWAPNPATYATATSILGEWTDHGSPITGAGAADTFSSQSTSVIPVDAAAGKFIYMGDRWTPSDLAHAPLIWLPLSFGEAGSLALEGPTEWTLADLAPAARYTVSADLPDHVWLGDAGSLPTSVEVTSGGRTMTTQVAWDTAALGRPGTAALTGTLQGAPPELDGKTFTRSVLVVPHGLKYVVNAGGAATADWTKSVAVAGTEGPLLNSVPEQLAGPDPVTAATWGYESPGSGTYGGAGDTIYSTLRYAAGKHDLSYSFDSLSPGKYIVYAGYFDPWPQANRAARVTLNGRVVEETRTFSGQPAAATYSGVEVGTDGKLTFTLTPTRSPDIQLSWVMIARPRAAQSITFAPIAERTWGDADVAVAPTASSGLPVSLAAAGACTASGGSVHLMGAGSCTLTASQAGNEDVAPAADIAQTFTVRTPVLDDFNRPDGAIGAAWSGLGGQHFYRIAGHRLDVVAGGPIVYRSAFGVNQEAAVTLTAVDPHGPAQGLLLKVGSAAAAGTTPMAGTVPESGAIAVAYDAPSHAVRVSTVRVGARSWTRYPSQRVSFAAGEELRARASADGSVTVYRGSEQVAAVSLNAADQAYFNAVGGRIGIWTIASPREVADDFRGGTIVG